MINQKIKSNRGDCSSKERFRAIDIGFKFGYYLDVRYKASSIWLIFGVLLIVALINFITCHDKTDAIKLHQETKDNPHLDTTSFLGVISAENFLNDTINYLPQQTNDGDPLDNINNLNIFVTREDMDYFDEINDENSNQFRFFADKTLDIIMRKFIASIERVKQGWHPGQVLSRLPPIRQLKLVYANTSDLLQDIEDLPIRGLLVAESIRYFQSRQWNIQNIAKICQHTNICETCPRVGTQAKYLCDIKCEKIRRKLESNEMFNSTEININYENGIHCELSKQATCPGCGPKFWCPEIPKGHMCPPRPICPENLCQIIRGNSSNIPIASKRSIEWCLRIANNANHANNRANLASCKWVLDSARAKAYNRAQFKIKQEDPSESNAMPVSASDYGYGINFTELIIMRGRSNAQTLLKDVRSSSSDWPAIIGRALRGTIGGFMEILGELADNSLPQKFVQANGNIYTHETNLFYAEKLLAAIEADLLRRLCRCPTCELFEPTIKCDCRQRKYNHQQTYQSIQKQIQQQQQQQLKTIIDDHNDDNYRENSTKKTLFYGQNTEGASRKLECDTLKICRPCLAPNHCPVPLGCPNAKMCHDCHDIGLNEFVEDDPETIDLLYDYDHNETITRDNLQKVFPLPQECRFCHDYRSCGKAPFNEIRFNTFNDIRFNTARIIGGQNATRLNWPFFAYVRTKKSMGTSVCGGVLISRRQVLTAGHCVSDAGRVVDAKNMRITTGKFERYIPIQNLVQNKDPNETEYHVSNICRLQNYMDISEAGVRYDMALLTLQDDVRFNEFAQPACLPRNLSMFNETKCYVIGMGKIGKSDDEKEVIAGRNIAQFLQEMQVKRVTCNAWHFSDSDRSRVCFTKVNAPGDSCDGDSGSPILCQNKLGRWSVLGLVSYGSSDCDGSDPRGWVGVYTRVSALLETLEHDCKLIV